MWKRSYILSLFLLLTGCSGARTLSLSYEPGLYRIGARMAPHRVNLVVVDARKQDAVGTLVSNAGWKLGTLQIGAFIDQTYVQALACDLEKMGYIIDAEAPRRLVATILDVQTTFDYESFRPSSYASARLEVALYEGEQVLFSKKYDGIAKDTYHLTGAKIAARNAADALQDAMRTAFTDPELLQTIPE